MALDTVSWVLIAFAVIYIIITAVLKCIVVSSPPRASSDVANPVPVDSMEVASAFFSESAPLVVMTLLGVVLFRELGKRPGGSGEQTVFGQQQQQQCGCSGAAAILDNKQQPAPVVDASLFSQDGSK